jgi:hypothetical protein
MVFDDLPSSYLAFLRDAAAPDPTSPMAKFIAAFEQAAPKLEGGETLPRATDVAQGRAHAPPPPALDPTVPPPGGAGTGMSPAARYGLIAAVVLVVAAVGWTVATRRNGGGEEVDPGRKVVDRNPGPTPGPGPTNPETVQKPPPTPEKRPLTAEDGVQLNALLNNERFTEAEVFVKGLEPVLLEDSYKTVLQQVRDARTRAVEKYILEALRYMTQNKLQEARDSLDQAIAAGGETEAVLKVKIQLERKSGNCPAVLAAIGALEKGFPTSPFIKQANESKRACQARPPISNAELQRAMSAVKDEVEGCLKAERPPEIAQLTTFDLAWTVTPGGAATQVTCTTPALTKTVLCQCLTEQVRRLRFQEKAGTQRRAQYTFNTAG